MLHTLQTTDRNSKVWWRCGGRHQCEGVEDGDTRPPLSGVPTLSRVPHLGPVTRTRTVVAAGVLTDGMMES